MDRILYLLGIIKRPEQLFDNYHRLEEIIKPSKITMGRCEVMSELIFATVHEYPDGYPKIAAFESCDPNFLIYKKFAYLHNRVLLYIQDELLQAGEELEDLDKLDETRDALRLVSRRRDDALGPRRRDLIKSIEQNLARYGKIPGRSSLLYHNRPQMSCFCGCTR